MEMNDVERSACCDELISLGYSALLASFADSPDRTCNGSFGLTASPQSDKYCTSGFISCTATTTLLVTSSIVDSLLILRVPKHCQERKNAMIPTRIAWLSFC